MYRAAGLTLREGDCLYDLGITLTRAGQPAPAIGELTLALDIYRSHRRPLWEGLACVRIAEAHLAARQYESAVRFAEYALALGDVIGAWQRATVLTLLGHARSALGQKAAARACWSEALGIYERVGSLSEDLGPR